MYRIILMFAFVSLKWLIRLDSIRYAFICDDNATAAKTKGLKKFV